MSQVKCLIIVRELLSARIEQLEAEIAALRLSGIIKEKHKELELLKGKMQEETHKKLNENFEFEA